MGAYPQEDPLPIQAGQEATRVPSGLGRCFPQGPARSLAGVPDLIPPSMLPPTSRNAPSSSGALVCQGGAANPFRSVLGQTLASRFGSLCPDSKSSRTASRSRTGGKLILPCRWRNNAMGTGTSYEKVDTVWPGALPLIPREKAPIGGRSPCTCCLLAGSGNDPHLDPAAGCRGQPVAAFQHRGRTVVRDLDHDPLAGDSHHVQ